MLIRAIPLWTAATRPGPCLRRSSAARPTEQLSLALDTRIVIEQAKGMIAQRRGVDMHTAFGALRDHARTHNLRLAGLARDVTDGRQDLATLGHP